MSLHTMPLNVGDFLRDTQELSDAEGGAYIFILIALWGSKEARIPNNPTVLRRIARCGAKKWSSTWPALAPYLEVSDEWVTHKRVTLERQRVSERVSKNRANGKKGGEANALNYQDTEEANASANALAKSKRSPKQSKPKTEDKYSEAKASDAGASEAMSVQAQIFAVGRPMLERAGSDKKSVGAALGALIKAKGEVEALRIITAMRADAKGEPESYIWKIVKGKTEAVEDAGAAPQLELVLIDGKPTMRPIGRAA